MKNNKDIIRIGFDFDKVFVNYPPFVPGKIIDWLYKKHNHKLSYRIPKDFEQKIRILSHTTLIRPAIKENVNFLPEITKKENLETYLISSRFGFLKNKTESWIKKHKIKNYFKGLYFNFENNQPHIFKDKMIKELSINSYIDDDLDLLLYLAEKNKNVNFFYLSKKKASINLPSNIKQITNLKEFCHECL